MGKALWTANFVLRLGLNKLLPWLVSPPAFMMVQVREREGGGAEGGEAGKRPGWGGGRGKGERCRQAGWGGKRGETGFPGLRPGRWGKQVHQLSGAGM